MKALNKQTGQLEKVYVKALDSMPVGTIVEFNGQASDIPSGWEEVSGENKIRKVSLKTPTGAHIVDGYSTSTTDGYSCNESNILFQTKGQVLWANSSPTSEFSPQTITFNGTYDYYDVISWVEGVTFETTRVYLSKRTIIQIMEGGFVRTRYATATNNSIEFSKGTFYTTYASGTDNNYQCIPYQIIGYKN